MVGENFRQIRIWRSAAKKMAYKRKKKSKNEEVVVSTEDLQQIRGLTAILERHGIQVRRENLSRGHSYRVKSGECTFVGNKIVFVDRRLPGKQQVSVLLDFIAEQEFKLSAIDLQSVPEHSREIFSTI